MNDRESIVTFLHNLASGFDGDTHEYRLTCTLAEQIERGDDLKPAKAPATVADLLGLNDLDLGALAQAADGVEALCRTLDENAERLEEFVRDECHNEPTRHMMTHSARVLAALGAKVRAALPQDAKPAPAAEPRIAQSHEEAAPGSLWARLSDGRLVIRLFENDGLNVPPARLVESSPWAWTCAWNDFPARLVADDLTEDECRTLAGMTRDAALAWCAERKAARRG